MNHEIINLNNYQKITKATTIKNILNFETVLFDFALQLPFINPIISLFLKIVIFMFIVLIEQFKTIEFLLSKSFK
ncbi:hypothetical protein EELLY_v1c08000 [Entomoplasma ellychniae]|uniref:Uncharacterized protein n=1 Tax=Entomoplasma ellychniae TaxID=2114 RepID=A0A8E2UDQ3_9MOLU|nr:hypothetical protein [Entomoplasma ellychniae]PPE03815.1 hypothetical protein EELLY_v1c08000 [Entomoplasma ellychniae]